MHLLPLVLMACTEVGLNDTSKGPEVTLVTPLDGGTFDPRGPVEVCASIEYEGSIDTLEAVVVSDVDGTLASTGFTPCDGGDLGVTVDLSDAPQVVSMTVTDVQGRSSTDQASLTPRVNTAPTCTIVVPADGTAVPTGSDVTLTVALDDVDGDPLELTIESTLDGELATGPATAGSNATFDLALTSGSHDLVVTVRDDRGASGLCVVGVDVVDCEDVDGDGFETCDGDCDDGDATVYPGADELVDGQDNDCDGDTDEGSVLFDDDGDGFTEVDGDCDDTDATINPSATETPDDGIDQDCSGSDAVTCFVDDDDDGYGGTTSSLSPDGDCDEPGLSATDDDCDDTDDTVHPGAAEVPADGIDQDCDGIDPAGCYADTDGDGFGSSTILPAGDGDCDDPGESAFGTDCNDTDASIFPGAVEVLDDGIDQDCSNADRVTCYEDGDSDGFGGTVVAPEEGSCTQGEATSDDCDDADPASYPGAPETPDDGIDQDCDGTDAIRCFEDGDFDGYGSAVVVVALDGSCDTGDNEADDDLDCDDTLASVYPGAPEVVNDGIDQDCDGADASECFEDLDGDGWGTSTTVASMDADCTDPGEADASGDCNDADPDISPGDAEIPDDGIDQDCSGDDTITCYVDGDGDGVGGASTTLAADGSCDTGDSESSTTGDCADGNPNRFPGNPEVPDDGIDQDCSGSDTITCYRDLDGDGYGGVAVLAADGSCDAAQDEAALDGDCADGNPNRFPGNPEIPDDGIDQDCSGDDSVTCYTDSDDDDFGVGSGVLAEGACGALLADVDGDCDDNDPDAYPGAPETYGDGIDQDCDGADGVECYQDLDQDTWGSAVVVQATDGTCDTAQFEADREGDCNDTNPAVNPDGDDSDATDGIDGDCDGVDGTDADGDGYAGGTGPDCDDADPDVNPGASETRDATDEDCDGLCDEGLILAGDLIVTELMIDPVEASDAAGEWFEIKNVSGADIRLCGGWSFGDQQADDWPVDVEVLIPDEGYIVAGKNGNTAVNGNVDIDIVYGANEIYLANDPDEIELWFDGTRIFSLVWGFGFETAGTSRQLSLDLVVPTAVSDPADWCDSVAPWPGSDGDFGTPGADNVTCP